MLYTGLRPRRDRVADPFVQRLAQVFISVVGRHLELRNERDACNAIPLIPRADR